MADDHPETDAPVTAAIRRRDWPGSPTSTRLNHFAAFVRGLVPHNAPELFALVAEGDGHPVAEIVVWGRVSSRRVELLGADGRHRMSMRLPQDALRRCSWGERIRPRLVWLNPADKFHRPSRSDHKSATSHTTKGQP